MDSLIKKRILYVAKLVVGIGLVVWIMSLIDLGVFLGYFQELSPGTVLLVSLISVFSLYVQYWRWKYLLHCNSDDVSKADLVSSFFAGFSLRLILPGGHAEISKIILLRGKKKGKLFAFGFEKVSQTLIKLFLVLMVLPLIFPALTPYCIVLLTALLLAVFIIPRLRLYRRFQEKQSSYYSMLAWNVVFSLLVFVLMATQYYILLNRVSPIGIWPVTHISIYLWGSGIIPISISGLGVREGLSVYFFNDYGILPAQAVATSLFVFALGSIGPALIGIYYLAKQRDRFGEMKSVLMSSWDFVRGGILRKQSNIFPVKSLLKSMKIIQVKITRKRILNVIKLLSSMFLSRLLRRQIVWGYPIYLMVEPTNICNLKCPMCPSGNGEMSRALGKLTFENYKKLIDDIGEYVLQVQLWNQGEPLINRSFLDFVKYANSKGIMTQTSTNGHFIRTDEAARELIQSGLDVLIFSMDGTNQETYKKYRVGGNFNLVFETLERISREKEKSGSKTPLVELQFIVFKHNEGEMDQLVEIARKFRVNRISFKTAQVYSNDQAETFLPDRDDLKRYKQGDNGFEMNGDLKNWCKRLWLNSTINWDGSVAPCCFDKDAENAFANIFRDDVSFKKVWKNGKYSAFRKHVMDDRKSIEMCTNCTEGLKVPYIKIVELEDL